MFCVSESVFFSLISMTVLLSHCCSPLQLIYVFFVHFLKCRIAVLVFVFFFTGNGKCVNSSKRCVCVCWTAVHFEQGQYDECIQECEEAVNVGREHRADFKLIAK